MFAYCGNNPVLNFDSTGTKNVSIFEYQLDRLSETDKIKYDVPLYDQGDLSLCWAYSQAMVAATYYENAPSQYWANCYARMLAVQENGWLFWNNPDWPTNMGRAHTVQSAKDLYKILATNGPAYALYGDGKDISSSKSQHMVVVTGIDCSSNTVYTNNPWGYAGRQSFTGFRTGVWQGSSQYDGMSLLAVYPLR